MCMTLTVSLVLPHGGSSQQGDLFMNSVTCSLTSSALRTAELYVSLLLIMPESGGAVILP